MVERIHEHPALQQLVKISFFIVSDPSPPSSFSYSIVTELAEGYLAEDLLIRII